MSTCFYPLRVLRDAENNLVFTNEGIPSLPCGQCLGCRLNHAEGWAIRMMHEASCHEENSFLTLTYSEEHLPSTKNLSYRAVTGFIKRLRKALTHTPYHKKLKYYYVGEYGENFARPHYHIILFGFDFSYGIRYKGSENIKTPEYTKNDATYYSSTFLTDLWGKGICHIGDVNYNTCMYVAKYVTKKVNGRNKDSHYVRTLDDGEIVEVVPEKAFMSRKEAIGKKWLQQFWTDVYPSDEVVHETRRLKTPAYYDKWLEKNNPELFLQVKQHREAGMLDLGQRSLSDLSRIHEVKVLNQKNSSRDLEGAPTANPADEKILAYSKRERITLHQRSKKC